MIMSSLKAIAFSCAVSATLAFSPQPVGSVGVRRIHGSGGRHAVWPTAVPLRSVFMKVVEEEQAEAVAGEEDAIPDIGLEMDAQISVRHGRTIDGCM